MSLVMTRARWTLDHDLDVYTQQRESLYLTKSGDSGAWADNFSQLFPCIAPVPIILWISGYPRGVSQRCLTRSYTAARLWTGIQSGVAHWTLNEQH